MNRTIACATVLGLLAAASWAQPERRALWVDMLEGEPLAYADMVADLASVDVVYLGETHSLERHHALQAEIIRDLAAGERGIVVAMEQLLVGRQPEVDRYNAGETSFDELAAAIAWGKTWGNYADYRGVLDAARAARGPVLGLNVERDVLVALARDGLDGLAPELRAALPEELDLENPVHDRALSLAMPAHGGMGPEMLAAMRRAQMARDECMADALCRFLRSEEGRGRVAVVLCGSWHAAFGVGMPARVRRRMPELRDRIVLMSDSGDLVLSPQEAAMAEHGEVTHEDLRALGAPLADYLHVVEPAE